jgi:hypothetical protein
MRYTKPAITSLLKSSSTIQQQNLPDSEKSGITEFDDSNPRHACTTGAYEADE